MADTDHTTSSDPVQGPDRFPEASAPGGGGPGGPGSGPGTEPGGPGGTPRFTRRQVLTLAGAGGLVGAGLLANRWIDDSPVAERRAAPSTTAPDTTPTSEPAPAGPPPMARWSDPATWGGQVPGPADVAGISSPVLLDVDAEVAGVQIAEGGELVFDPAASRTLSSAGNVLVNGALRARPQDASIVHRIVFPSVDESRIVGGHIMTPVDTDVGLWATGNGVLDLVGTPKKAWTNLAGEASAGAATITVADASGWQPGDEVVITPTVPTTTEGFAEMQDRRVVESIDGTTVHLDGPLEFDHPAVTVREGVTHRAEVLNLTRNVLVEGTPEGRAHVIMLDIKVPQAISHVGLRHLGPQGAYTGDEGEQGVQGIEGRYALHFHMSNEAARGSVVDGVVAYDGGNHSFVPHLAHGITFRDCVAHDMSESAFWWDPSTGDDEEGDSVPTNDLVYERCVASHIKTTDATEYETTGFMIGSGSGNVARGCVATGILGSDESNPGYQWHPKSTGGDWAFEDNLSHNNDGSSIYFWVNNTPPTLIDRFTAYHDRHGVRAGAYINLASYRDMTVYACQTVGVLVVAVPGIPEERPDLTITYENVYVDQAGMSDFAFEVGGHVIDPDGITRVIGCDFRGGNVAQVGFPESDEYAQLYEFTDCSYEGTAFWIADDLTEVVDIRVNDSTHGSIALYPAGREGEPRPEWNASVVGV